MAKLLKLRRGTTSQHGSFTGAEGEVTVDTDKETLVVHNGSTAGGFALSRADSPDNQKTRWGTGNDLEIFHDGSNSFIKDVGTGNLAICGSLVAVHAADATENMILCSQNGAVQLYYDNVKKFETDANGALVSGRLKIPDNDGNGQQLVIGNSADFKIYHNGTNTVIDNDTGDLYIGGNFIGIYNSALNELKIAMYDNGAVNLYYDGSKTFGTISGGAEVTGQLYVTAELNLINGSTNSHRYIDAGLGDGNTLSIRATSGGDANHETMASFTRNAGVELFHDTTKRFETKSYGARFHGTLEGVDNEKIQLGSSGDLQIYYNGSHSRIDHVGPGNLYINVTSSETAVSCIQNGAVQLWYDNSKKFETRSDGAEVFGDLRFGDNKDANFGNDADLKIYHDGSHSYIHQDGTGTLYNLANTYRFNNETNTENIISADANGAVTLYNDNSVRIATTSTGAKFRGSSTGFYGVMETNDGNNRGYIHANSAETVGFLDDQQHWLINGTKNAAANLYYDNSKKVETVPNGINVTGRIGIGDTTPTYDLEVKAAAPQLRLEETSTGGSKRLDAWVSSSGQAYIGANQSAQSLIFQTTSNDRFEIKDDGDIVQKSQAGANDTPGLIWNGGSSSQQANLVKLHAKQVSNWGGEFMVKVKGANGSLSDNWQDAIRVFPEGSVTKPKQPSFCARHTSRHTYSHGGNNHSYNTEMWDVNSDYNTSNNRFTAPQNGYYFLLHVVNVRGNTSGVLEAKIYINDSEVLRSYEYYAGGNTGCTVQACGVRYLNANDYVTPHSHWGGSTGADQHWENSGTKPLVFFQGHLAH